MGNKIPPTIKQYVDDFFKEENYVGNDFLKYTLENFFKKITSEYHLKKIAEGDESENDESIKETINVFIESYERFDVFTQEDYLFFIKQFERNLHNGLFSLKFFLELKQGATLKEKIQLEEFYLFLNERKHLIFS